MVFKFINKKSDGFSLAQLLVILLVVAITMAATMPLITRKFKAVPRPALHGKWACTRDDAGNLIQAGARDATSSLPAIGTAGWIAGCAFPELPERVEYVLIQIIGGGASGQAAELILKQPGVEYLNTGVYTVDGSARYRVYVTSESGDVAGLLKASGEPYSFFGYDYKKEPIGTGSWLRYAVPTAQCHTSGYTTALPGPNVTLSFERRFTDGETLQLQYTSTSAARLAKANSFDSAAMCATVSSGTAYLLSDGTLQNYAGNALVPSGQWTNRTWSFLRPDRTTSSRVGRDSTLLLNNQPIVQLLGSFGGVWTGNKYENTIPACTAVSCNRYVPLDPFQIDPDPTSAPHAVSVTQTPKQTAGVVAQRPQNGVNGFTNYQAFANMFSSAEPMGNSIMLLDPINIYQGGCGGAHGETITVLTQLAGNENYIINRNDFGVGGISPTVNGTGLANVPGSNTTFADLVARGGNGCALIPENNQGPGRSSEGASGGNGAGAPTTARRDSIGGTGGRIQSNVANRDRINGQGIGAGGGGGGGQTVGAAPGTPLYARAGNGHAGGIIVSW